MRTNRTIYQISKLLIAHMAVGRSGGRAVGRQWCPDQLLGIYWVLFKHFGQYEQLVTRCIIWWNSSLLLRQMDFMNGKKVVSNQGNTPLNIFRRTIMSKSSRMYLSHSIMEPTPPYIIPCKNHWGFLDICVLEHIHAKHSQQNNKKL